MFGSDKKNGRPTSAVDSLIGSRTTIRGDLSFAGGLHVDGRVVGAIVADEDATDAVLMVSAKGRIEGEVRAPHVVIHGEMHGDIIASERVELGAHARVTGNIHYKLLEMSAGAQVNGKIVREEEPRKRLTGPERGEAADAAADA